MKNGLEQVMGYLPLRLCAVLKEAAAADLSGLEEIRLRAGKPFMLCTGSGDFFFSEHRKFSSVLPEKPVMVWQNDISSCISALFENSVYALNHELKNGYLTLKGGHRAGFCGRAVLSEGSLAGIKEFSSINFRIAREHKGCGLKVERFLRTGPGRIQNALIISPPQCGKTTLLRDLARILGGSVKVGIIDERSEIAGCVHGIPSFDVGLRTDILDGCPKRQGMEILLRAMSPDVIITDEIGNSGDREALMAAVNAGAGVVASAHGYGLGPGTGRREVEEMIAGGLFGRIIILGRSQGPGTVEEVLDGRDRSVLYRRDGYVA
ncbi:MAG TPA: stage III sporulation protein AA [Clostridiales bacterium]|nr:stage III sporulation protein AA [Clostridiales bacterium]